MTTPIQQSPRRWWALLSLVPAVLAVGLDGTILSVALPTLGGELDATTGQLQWFVTAYALAFAAAMIPAGMLGDRWGRRRVLLGALGVFGIGSVACAAASGPTTFILARVVLGIGAAAILPMALAATPYLFTEEERPRALGVLMSVTMLGFPLGPLLGGWLLSNAWWGWVFLINVPVVAVALVAVRVLMPESRGARAGRIDLGGVALSATSLTVLSYGVIEAGDRGWTDARSVLLVLAGIALVAAFVWWQRRALEPLVDLRLFASRAFSGGAVVSTVVSFVMMGLLFTLPLYTQTVHGLDAEGSGVRLLPLIAGMLLTALPSGLLAKRIGQRATVAAGMVVLAVGLGWGATTGVGDGSWASAGWTVVCGAGLGLSLPTAMDAALGAVPADAEGVGSAVLQALRMVGSSFGAAILGSVLNAGYRGDLPTDAPSLRGLAPDLAAAARDSVVGASEIARSRGSADLLHAARSAFVHGMDLTLWVSSGLALAGAVLAVVALAGREPAPAVVGADSVHEHDPIG
ncbi:DHA2 family efflux MFS transporter permease subunit [Nocardioides sp. T2.26MG-1]|uniref:DHA2 family efflux MFS transporter permease subunit n=1 Tax=Nocardioides sp. T2.26MG-1 TaxID=3041166 RepID=UPI0024778456|nr:DHA2 family efflux MFS transporter permease subunit [Nocardioides sp. T2.26MG-1]CAI9419217.1 Antiseptic resistance protein [Nocardioides sp. T2.26MG-1]